MLHQLRPKRRNRTRIMLDREAERRRRSLLEFDDFLTLQEARIRYFVGEGATRLCTEEEDTFLVSEAELEIRK
jgi:hypothetical protein